MNFKFERFFYLAISFIIGSFFFIFGAFSVILPWSSYLQAITTRFILENTLILSLFGFGFILIGLSLVIYTLLKTRHRYVHIRTGHFSVILDESVIHQYLETYWQERFPKFHIPFNLNLKKSSLHIVVELPPHSLSEQKALLEEIKLDFGNLFGKVLGYPYDVHLIANFQIDKFSS